MKKISVVIVDDHKLIRQMWEIMFAVNNEIEITGESATVDGAIEMITFHLVQKLLRFQCIASRLMRKKCCSLVPGLM